VVETKSLRRVTMADIARDADVSVMTVSYTFSQPERVSRELRQAVLHSVERLGYPGPNPAARSLRRGRSDNIGVVVGEGLTYAFEDPQSTRFLAGVAEVCVEHRQGLVLIPVTGHTTDIDRVREAAVDSFIIFTGVERTLLDAMLSTGRPVAAQGWLPTDRNASVGSGERAPRSTSAQLHLVGVDDRGAARTLAEVVFAGANRPAVISFPLVPKDEARIETGPVITRSAQDVAKPRLQGIRDYCRQAGIDWRHVPVVFVRNNRQDARWIIGELFDRPSPPDAVVAMSDELALATLDVLSERQLHVPTDVAVSGWDDADGAAAAGLTTIHQSLHEQGSRCAQLVLGEPVATTPLSWNLVRRSSTR
jgi:DNA-binding LacI/PurR family transcriptional regulator